MNEMETATTAPLGTTPTSSLEGPSSSSMLTVMEEKLQPPVVATTVKKIKTGRCPQCRAKVGLLGYPCRCGLTFCSTHRYASEHNCTFDYKEDGREQIKKNNPVVVGEKIHKI
jgi:predicted nucleic acid binding AN1-type Zn finger protein